VRTITFWFLMVVFTPEINPPVPKLPKAGRGSENTLGAFSVGKLYVSLFTIH
jgi:hypothetical protein